MPTPIIEDRLLGGPGQFLQNLLEGDTAGATAALSDPTELSPRERDAFLKKHGLDKGPFTPIYRVMTNPAVIISAALSLKFPVPTAQNIFKYSERLSGYTAKYPILRKLASMQTWFRGTPVPEIYGQILTDVNDFKSQFGGHWGTSLEKFKQATGRYPTAKEQLMVGAYLDGLHLSTRGWQGKNGVVKIGDETLPAVGPLAPALEAHMPAPLLKYAKEMRGMLDDVWTKMFGTKESRDRIIRAIQRSNKAGHYDDISDAMLEWAKNPTKVPHYFPRQVQPTDDDLAAMLRTLTQKGSPREYAKAATRKSRAVVGPNALHRDYQMLPSLANLDQLSDVLDPEQVQRLQNIAKARILNDAKDVIGPQAIQRLRKLDYRGLRDPAALRKILDEEDALKFSSIVTESKPREYSLVQSHVFRRYLHTMAGTYGWTATGGGEKLLDEVGVLRSLGQNDARAKMRLAMLEETYIPLAMGRPEFQQALKAQSWDQSLMETAAFLDKPAFKNLLGTELHRRMTETLTESRGAFSLINMERKAAGYFYLSTLGLNPASAMKNLLQLVLTTGPVVGFQTAAKGATEAFRKSHKYFALRYGSNLSHEDALRGAYKEFGESGLVATPLADEAVSATLDNAYTFGGTNLPGSIGTTKEKIARAMMRMFSLSEHAVRLSTFEAGLIKAKQSGLEPDDAIKFAKKLTEITQFPAGPQNRPYGLLNKSPLVGQMLNFPLKMAEFATSTAFSLGSGEKSILGMNPGTAARMYMGSAVAYELGNAFGVDMSDALMGSAIPTFQEPGKMFAPIPVVPPIFQLGGALATAAASGDTEELKRALPLLVPGGVGVARAVGTIPGSERAAQWLERSYADYEAPSPTGRIAVYSGQGQLRGFFTPWEVFTMGVGIKAGNVAAEEELRRTIVANRDEIRAQRGEYIQARITNNPTRAEGIANSFKTRYGFGIPVSEKDIQAAQLRRSIPRLESLVKTMPAGPIRDQYVQMIATYLGGEGQQFLGVDPQLLGGPQAAASPSRQQTIGGQGGGGGRPSTSTQFSGSNQPTGRRPEAGSPLNSALGSGF